MPIIKHPVPSGPSSICNLDTFLSHNRTDGMREERGRSLWLWRYPEGNGRRFNVALQRRSVVANWLLCCCSMVYALPSSHLDRPFAGRHATSSYTSRAICGATALSAARICYFGAPPPSVRIEREYEWSVSILPGEYSSHHPSIHPSIAFSSTAAAVLAGCSQLVKRLLFNGTMTYSWHRAVLYFINFFFSSANGSRHYYQINWLETASPILFGET